MKSLFRDHVETSNFHLQFQYLPSQALILLKVSAVKVAFFDDDLDRRNEVCFGLKDHLAWAEDIRTAMERAKRSL